MISWTILHAFAKTQASLVRRYAASSAMEEMGESIQAAGEIIQHFMDVWAEELEGGHLRGESLELSEAERESGLLRLETGILQKRVAAPLGQLPCPFPTRCDQSHKSQRVTTSSTHISVL
jgi:hypothetical protein